MRSNNVGIDKIGQRTMDQRLYCHARDQDLMEWMKSFEKKIHGHVFIWEKPSMRMTTIPFLILGVSAGKLRQKKTQSSPERG